MLEIGDGVFEVWSTCGDTFLGGEDFDYEISQHLAQQFKIRHNIDLSHDPIAVQRLKQAAETAKIELSFANSTQVDLPFIHFNGSKFTHLQEKITRNDLEQLIKPLVARSIAVCKQAISDCQEVAKRRGCTAPKIGAIVLVGGSTRIPLVQARLKELFGLTPLGALRREDAVALGAAVQAGVLKGVVKDVLLLDVIPMSLGIETLGGAFTRLIDRNSMIPAKESRVFSTAEDGQRAVTIRVFQGERDLAADNKLLGQFDLVGIPPAPRGVPQIEVTFDIDANGIAHVSARDNATGKEQSVRIQASGGLSDTEIDRIITDAEDKEEKELVEARNHAEALVYATEKQLADNASNRAVTAVKPDAEKAIAALKEVLKREDAEAIKESTNTLAQEAMKIGEAFYSSGPIRRDRRGESSPSPMTSTVRPSQSTLTRPVRLAATPTIIAREEPSEAPNSSVSSASGAAANAKPYVFVSYAHEDSTVVRHVEKVLTPLVRTGKIGLWIDRQIAAGDEWERKIFTAIEQSNIAILLLSNDFLCSEFIAKRELPAIFAEKERRRLTLMPILVRPCPFELNDDLAKFQLFNKPEAPLVSLKEWEMELELVRLAREINKANEL